MYADWLPLSRESRFRNCCKITKHRPTPSIFRSRPAVFMSILTPPRWLSRRERRFSPIARRLFFDIGGSLSEKFITVKLELLRPDRSGCLKYPSDSVSPGGGKLV